MNSLRKQTSQIQHTPSLLPQDDDLVESFIQRQIQDNKDKSAVSQHFQNKKANDNPSQVLSKTVRLLKIDSSHGSIITAREKNNQSHKKQKGSKAKVLSIAQMQADELGLQQECKDKVTKTNCLKNIHDKENQNDDGFQGCSKNTQNLFHSISSSNQQYSKQSKRNDPQAIVQQHPFTSQPIELLKRPEYNPKILSAHKAKQTVEAVTDANEKNIQQERISLHVPCPRSATKINTIVATSQELQQRQLSLKTNVGNYPTFHEKDYMSNRSPIKNETPKKPQDNNKTKFRASNLSKTVPRQQELFSDSKVHQNVRTVAQGFNCTLVNPNKLQIFDENYFDRVDSSRNKNNHSLHNVDENSCETLVRGTEDNGSGAQTYTQGATPIEVHPHLMESQRDQERQIQQCSSNQLVKNDKDCLLFNSFTVQENITTVQQQPQRVSIYEQYKNSKPEKKPIKTNELAVASGFSDSKDDEIMFRLNYSTFDAANTTRTGEMIQDYMRIPLEKNEMRNPTKECLHNQLLLASKRQKKFLMLMQSDISRTVRSPPKSCFLNTARSEAVLGVGLRNQQSFRLRKKGILQRIASSSKGNEPSKAKGNLKKVAVIKKGQLICSVEQLNRASMMQQSFMMSSDQAAEITRSHMQKALSTQAIVNTKLKRTQQLKKLANKTSFHGSSSFNQASIIKNNNDRKTRRLKCIGSSSISTLQQKQPKSNFDVLSTKFTSNLDPTEETTQIIQPDQQTKDCLTNNHNKGNNITQQLANELTQTLESQDKTGKENFILKETSEGQTTEQKILHQTNLNKKSFTNYKAQTSSTQNLNQLHKKQQLQFLSPTSLFKKKGSSNGIKQESFSKKSQGVISKINRFSSNQDVQLSMKDKMRHIRSQSGNKQDLTKVGANKLKDVVNISMKSMSFNSVHNNKSSTNNQNSTSNKRSDVISKKFPTIIQSPRSVVISHRRKNDQDEAHGIQQKDNETVSINRPSKSRCSNQNTNDVMIDLNKSILSVGSHRKTVDFETNIRTISPAGVGGNTERHMDRLFNQLKFGKVPIPRHKSVKAVTKPQFKSPKANGGRESSSKIGGYNQSGRDVVQTYSLLSGSVSARLLNARQTSSRNWQNMRTSAEMNKGICSPNLHPEDDLILEEQLLNGKTGNVYRLADQDLTKRQKRDKINTLTYGTLDNFKGQKNKKAPVPVVIRKEKVRVVNESNQTVIVERKTASTTQDQQQMMFGGIQLCKPFKQSSSVTRHQSVAQKRAQKVIVIDTPSGGINKQQSCLMLMHHRQLQPRRNTEIVKKSFKDVNDNQLLLSQGEQNQPTNFQHGFQTTKNANQKQYQVIAHNHNQLQDFKAFEDYVSQRSNLRNDQSCSPGPGDYNCSQNDMATRALGKSRQKQQINKADPRASALLNHNQIDSLLMQARIDAASGQQQKQFVFQGSPRSSKNLQNIKNSNNGSGSNIMVQDCTDTSTINNKNTNQSDQVNLKINPASDGGGLFRTSPSVTHNNSKSTNQGRLYLTRVANNKQLQMKGAFTDSSHIVTNRLILTNRSHIQSNFLEMQGKSIVKEEQGNNNRTEQATFSQAVDYSKDAVKKDDNEELQKDEKPFQQYTQIDIRALSPSGDRGWSRQGHSRDQSGGALSSERAQQKSVMSSKSQQNLALKLQTKQNKSPQQQEVMLLPNVQKLSGKLANLQDIQAQEGNYNLECNQTNSSFVFNINDVCSIHSKNNCPDFKARCNSLKCSSHVDPISTSTILAVQKSNQNQDLMIKSSVVDSTSSQLMVVPVQWLDTNFIQVIAKAPTNSSIWLPIDNLQTHKVSQATAPNYMASAVATNVDSSN